MCKKFKLSKKDILEVFLLIFIFIWFYILRAARKSSLLIAAGVILTVISLISTISNMRRKGIRGFKRKDIALKLII